MNFDTNKIKLIIFETTSQYTTFKNKWSWPELQRNISDTIENLTKDLITQKT